jgi:hypothetical protein
MTNDGPEDAVCNAARGGLGFIITRDEAALEGQDKQCSVWYAVNKTINVYLLTPKVNVVQIGVHYFTV